MAGGSCITVHGDDLSTDDERLAAALVMLAVRLAETVGELRAGQFDQPRRHRLAGVLDDMGRQLRGEPYLIDGSGRHCPEGG
jgi:hypothetical protein